MTKIKNYMQRYKRLNKHSNVSTKGKWKHFHANYFWKAFILTSNTQNIQYMHDNVHTHTRNKLSINLAYKINEIDISIAWKK